MKPLPLRPMPHQYESLSDFIVRLADANGYHRSDLQSILTRQGRNHADVLMSALTLDSLPSFSGPVVSQVSIPVMEYGLRKADFTRYYPRWCPLCIKEEPWLRPVWRIKVATVCHAHRVRLLQTCPAVTSVVN